MRDGAGCVVSIRTNIVALVVFALSPALGLAGTDEESAATWLPGSNKSFNDARASLDKNGVDFGLIYATFHANACLRSFAIFMVWPFGSMMTRG